MDAPPTTRQRWNHPLRAPAINPILLKELRGRMRGPRAFGILTAFLLLLGGVAFLLYKALEESFRYAYGPAGMSAMVGVSLFLGLAYFELFLVAFITPALTAGTISSEQEAQTYEMLVATPLGAHSILLGKMAAALFYIFLLIFAAVPLLSLVFIFGGVTVRDVGIALAILLVTAITFGLIGIFWSALLRRTGRATVMSYLTLLAFIVGPMVLAAIWSIMRRQSPPPILHFPSPFAALGSVVTLNPEMGLPFGGSPLFLLFNATGNFGGPPISYAHPGWHWTLAFYGVISLLVGLVTLWLVRPRSQRRIHRPALLLALGLIALTIGGLSGFFSLADWQQVLTSPDVEWQRVNGGMIEPAIDFMRE